MTLYIVSCTEDTDGGVSSDTQFGVYHDFRHIFSQSDFDGDPEKTAFAFFKPHLGNIDFQEDVSEKQSVRISVPTQRVLPMRILY